MVLSTSEDVAGGSESTERNPAAAEPDARSLGWLSPGALVSCCAGTPPSLWKVER